MKRSPFPPRKTPMPRGDSELKPGTPLRRTPLPRQRLPLSGGGLSRSSGVVKPGPPQVYLPKQRLPRSARSQIAGTTRTAVLDRSDGLCDWCAVAVSVKRWECHHRKLRSQGGRNDVATLIVLHARCHEAVHANRDGLSYATGFLVPRSADPAAWPLLRWRGTDRACWSLPTPDGWSPAVPCARQIELGATPTTREAA